MIYVFDLPKKKLNKLLSVAEAEKKPINKKLAGNIRKEINLEKYTHLLEDFLLKQFKNSGKLNDEVRKLNILTNPTSLVLKELWLNYQTKYEFNPFHNHSGLLSFKKKKKIPFLMADEHKVSPGVGANKNLSGVLQFFYLSSNNYKDPISTKEFYIDKSWEGKGLMFHSNLYHLVYPFFSSDDYRITFSGNIFLKNDSPT